MPGVTDCFAGQRQAHGIKAATSVIVFRQGLRMMADRKTADGVPSRPYSISLQQAAAAIFGVALVDGDMRRKSEKPKGRPQQS